MKFKFLLTLGFVTMFFFSISGIFTLLSLSTDNIVYAQPEEEEEPIQARPVPYTRPDPTIRTGKSRTLRTTREAAQPMGSKGTLQPGQKSMPIDPYNSPEQQGMPPDPLDKKLQKGMPIDPLDMPQQRGMPIDPYDSPQQQGMPIDPYGKQLQRGMPIDPYGKQSAMPTALQQRQQIQQKLVALGFTVAQIIPAGQGKWRVMVRGFNAAMASPALQGGITVADDGEHGDSTITIGFTSTGAMAINAASLGQAGFNANAGKLQLNGILLQ